MEEELACQVISRYLERYWGVRLNRRSSGPDFLHKGNAIEVKGSDFHWSDNVQQFARYAQEYGEVGIAFPTDALDTWNLIQMHVFASLSYSAFSKYLGIHLITDSAIQRPVPFTYPQKFEDSFGVLRFYNGSDIFGYLMSQLKSNAKFVDLKDAKSKKAEFEKFSQPNY